MSQQYNLRLSEAQKRNLHNGKAINVGSDANAVGPESYSLSSMVVNKLKRAKQAGKGARISLSTGGSVASQIKNTFPTTNVEQLAQWGVNTAEDRITDMAKQQLGNAQLALSGLSDNSLYQDFLGWASAAGEKELESAIKGIFGSIRGRGVYRVLHGQGFFDSLGDVLSNVSKVAAPILTDAALKKLLGKGNSRRKTQRNGAGFFDDLGSALTGTLSSVSNIAAPVLTQAALNKLLGKGIKRNMAMQYQAGNGLYLP